MNVCWLDDIGVIKDPLEPGEIYMVNSPSELEFRIPNKSIIAKSSFLRILTVNPSKLQFTKNTQGFYHCFFLVSTGGILQFHIEYTDPITHAQSTTALQEILIQPALKINNTLVDLHQMSLQTSLSRCLGPLSSWKSSLAGEIEIGFNLFHITSIQALGKYGSLYCIGDYLKLNPEFFPENDSVLTEEEKLEELRRTVNEIDALGGGLIIDIVLSHCSSQNPLFTIAPDAAYTLKNTPHLNSAYCLDLALQDLSLDMYENKANYLCRNRIESLKDVEYIMGIIRDLIRDLRLFEYFSIDTEKVLKKFIESENEVSGASEELIEQLKTVLRTQGLRQLIRKNIAAKVGEKRLGVKLRYSLCWAVCLSAGMSRETVLREVIKEIQAYNALSLSKYKRQLQVILTNIDKEIKYQKLELRIFEVSPNKPLVKPYFRKLATEEIALLNGFIVDNKNVSRDISEKWNYFKRNVISWRDCVKIKYGHRPEDCPKLWQVIEQYVTSMANIFKGFRIDNCHGLPIEATKYFIQKSRAVNPNLLVIAEFFSNSYKLDYKFVTEIGINYLVRESLAHNSVSSLADLIIETSHSSSIKRKIPVVLYDFTHDNPTILQCRTLQDAVSNSGLVSLSPEMIGSTRGYEEMIPMQLSVVEETRLYKKYPGYAEFDKDSISVIVTYNQIAEGLIIKGDWDGWKHPVSLVRHQDFMTCTLKFPAIQRGMSFGFKFSLADRWFFDPSQRHYTTWDGFTNNLLIVEPTIQRLSPTSQSLREVRKSLNRLKRILHTESYSAFSLTKFPNDTVCIIRENKKTLHKYVVVCRSAFRDENAARCEVGMGGEVDKMLMACEIKGMAGFQENKMEIGGVNFEVRRLELADFGNVESKTAEDVLIIHNAFPGFFAIFKVRPKNENIVIQIQKGLDLLNDPKNCQHLFVNMALQDLSFLLWRTKSEELATHNRGCYNFPGLGEVKFAGLGGLVCAHPDPQGSPSSSIFSNLTQGDWFIDYHLARLSHLKHSPLKDFISNNFSLIKTLSRPLLATFTLRFIHALFDALCSFFSNSVLETARISVKFWAFSSQMWVNENILDCCTVGKSEEASFESYFVVELLVLMGNEENALEVLKRGAEGIMECSYGVRIGYLYGLMVYLKASDKNLQFIAEEISGGTVGNIVFKIFKDLAHELLDLESGLVLLPPYQTWVKTSSRDGAAIEITATLHSLLEYWSEFPGFPQEIVMKTHTISLISWKKSLEKSFEQLYWIPAKDNSLFLRPELIKTRGIFKDAVGSKVEAAEYECRPSVFIAMCIAPGLFTENSAKKCIKTYQGILINEEKIAVKDSEENSDLEWVWMFGYYLVAAVKFGLESPESVWMFIEKVLERIENIWFCIPESVGSEKTSGLTVLAIMKAIKEIE